MQPELREHAPRATSVLKSCDFRAGAAADQGGIEPATAGLRKQARKPRDNFQRPFREQEKRAAPQRERFDTHDLRRGFAAVKTTSTRAIPADRRGQDRFARRHSESDATRTIPAEGSSGSRQIRTGPQRERSDTHDLRRGFIGLKTDSHGATVRAIRHARSPQRVRRGQARFARDHSESDPTGTIPAEGSSGSRQIRTGPQQERSDTHDPRRGFAEVKTNSHGATARAL